MKNIPSSLAEIDDDWLKGLFIEYGGFEAESIEHIAKQPMGEGIGQVGQFCKLVVTCKPKKKFSYFLKLRGKCKARFKRLVVENISPKPNATHLTAITNN
mgnify:CR=1 FL=1